MRVKYRHGYRLKKPHYANSSKQGENRAERGLSEAVKSKAPVHANAGFTANTANKINAPTYQRSDDKQGPKLENIRGQGVKRPRERSRYNFTFRAR